MAKVALLALIALVATLALLARTPGIQPGDPLESIVLHDAQVHLYPASDPEATWRFSARNVRYDPALRETTLTDLDDGERRVGSEVDFTLLSERLVIGRDDDIRAERMDVHLIEDDLDVELTGRDGRQVLVAQRDGRFEVPDLRMFGEGFGESRYQDVRVTFDFTDFEAGGPDTVGVSEFELSDRDPNDPPEGDAP